MSTALDTYDHAVRSAGGDLTALDLHARRLGLPTAPVAIRHVAADAQAGSHENYDSPLRLCSCPLALTLPDGTERFAFPADPQVAVNGRNTLALRHVAKSQARGTVKELWSQDDWQVTIDAVLLADDPDSLYNLMSALRTLLDADQPLAVESDHLQRAFAIDRIVVQTYQFAHTKNPSCQRVSITALSDDSHELLADSEE